MKLLLTNKKNYRYNWKLLEAWKYKGYTIPKGFVTDLASVPRFLWMFLAPSEIAKAAVLHDYLYHSKKVSRLEADKILRSCALQEVGRIRANLIYYAVRLNGWIR